MTYFFNVAKNIVREQAQQTFLQIAASEKHELTVDAIADLSGVTVWQAQKIVAAILQGQVPNTTIKY
jgi:hypothetical protein